MIKGTIVLEDITIKFQLLGQTNTVQAQIKDTFNNEINLIEVPQDKFFKALAIAVHNDGMPDYKKDYPDAESIMKTIRWIP